MGCRAVFLSTCLSNLALKCGNLVIKKLVIHHQTVAGDQFPHVFALASDCYCEPEVDDLGDDRMGIPIRLFRHQDMRGKQIVAPWRVQIHG